MSEEDGPLSQEQQTSDVNEHSATFFIRFGTDVPDIQLKKSDFSLKLTRLC